MTHTGGSVAGEITQGQSTEYRVFRRANFLDGAVKQIFQGHSTQIFAIDLGVDQLRMKDTYLAGDYEGTMAQKVVVDAVIEGQSYRAERTVADIFDNPMQA